MRELIERAKAGDHEAFSELGRLWVDRLYAIACLILRDPERAADATQEALIACWRDLRGLRDPDHFDSWIRRILVNACYREARRTQSRHRLEHRAREAALLVPAPDVRPDLGVGEVPDGRLDEAVLVGEREVDHARHRTRAGGRTTAGCRRIHSRPWTPPPT